MLRVAVPNKGALSEPANTMLREAGYRRRSDNKDLTLLDEANGVEFFFLRPKDIAIYVGNGQLDMGITGRDLAIESRAEISERIPLGFGASKFCWAGPRDSHHSEDQLDGLRIASAYPNLVRLKLAEQGVNAEVIRLDGAVEISIQLGVADIVADIVESGRTLAAHNLVPFGKPLCVSEAVLIERDGNSHHSDARDIFVARLQGVVFAQQYMMVDFDCPLGVLDAAVSITPGIESPTISPLADAEWVAVRSMVPRKQINEIMDRLYQVGARAILASDVRTCRI